MNYQPDILQTSNFAVLSINYEKADVEIRSKFTFFEDHVKEFVYRISDKKLGDAFVLSTCNRAEIYTTATNYLFIAEEYCHLVGATLTEFMQYANIMYREDALMHLFRVSAGLESQIVGDFEIIGQIKNAYNRFKKEKKYSNPYLERAINSAIQISKRIKNETGISNGAASVSYAAVHYILNHQTNLSEKNLLLLGVGEIGQNTVENLLKHLYKPKIKVINRSNEKAEKIADKHNIPCVSFKNLEKEIKETDVLILATSAREPIVNKSHLKDNKEILIIDLSVPNNVDKDVLESQNVTLVDVDILSAQIKKTMQQREQEIPKAEEIIKEMTQDFLEWEKARRMAPKIHYFKEILKNIERNEMHNIHKKHRYVDINDMELSENIVQKITNRFAKYIIDNPWKAEEITKIMHEIFVEQPHKEFNEKH